MSASIQTAAYAQIYVKNGTIDLRTHNFEKSEVIPLNGEWAFYWNQLLAPDGIDSNLSYHLHPFTKLWGSIDSLDSKGVATYRAVIYLPENYPPLALDIPDFYSSYLLFLNGKEISRNGTPAYTKEAYTPYWLPKTVSLGEIRSDTLELVLQIANFDHQKGGAYLPIKIGKAESLFDARYIEYGYSFVLTGALLMGGLFFFGLYLFGRHENAILFFSLFCIVYSYRIIGFGSYPLHFLIQEIPWIATLKLEYITLFLSGYLFGIYTLNLYPKETSKRLIYLFSGVSLLFLGISLFLSPGIFTHLVAPYFLVLIAYILYAFYVYTKAAINKSIGAGFALASTGIVFIVFLYQIMVYFGLFEEMLLLNFVGYLSFFFFQSLILSFRFAESLKIAKIQAEESSRAKSQFLSTMSHEIRTPLNAVIGLSGLLSDSELNEKQKEFSQTIKTSGESLLSIINNILDYSKIESGKLELEESEFNLKEVIENVFDLTFSPNSKRDLELIYQLEENVPEYIVGDSTRLQQILINLTSNAIKFTEEGEILIKVRVSEKNSDQITLEFNVSDTGIGIPEDRMNRLFQSFTQVDASSTRKYGGTGLGLVISKRIVEFMGGNISVNSVPNQGSTFTFTIKVLASNREDSITTNSVLEGKHLFILDDNTTNLSILKEQLEQNDMNVRVYSSSSEFLEKLDQLSTYDFGILDMQMPELDGIEVAEKIRSKLDKNHFPLVLLSSIHELENDEQRAMFNLYLTKPVKQTKLLRNLERMFQKKEENRIEKVAENKKGELFEKDLSILLVEDNLINQKVATKILEKIGLDADIANDGELALEMVKNKTYDLVFMDMEMPVMDGLDSTRAIHAASDDLPALPTIIAMTANALPGDRERCLEAGMNDFISKPITVESVRTILKKWFRDF
ncbi:MAG: response regulator [Balneolaceae bacterium]|nr:response regulator [Balneolaceae bacterium]MBO6546847.1 response regulator [Balneolaceae bacterium]MBO6649207.1 response regulator [Balneolaceae bacterium]